MLPVVHVNPPTHSRNECCSSIYLSARSHTCAASCGAPGTACQSAHARRSRLCTRHEGKQLFGGRCPPLPSLSAVPSRLPASNCTASFSCSIPIRKFLLRNHIMVSSLQSATCGNNKETFIPLSVLKKKIRTACHY